VTRTGHMEASVRPDRASSVEQKPIRSLALLHWGHVIEDFLDVASVGLEAFCNEMTGGWMFGYIEALRRVNISTVLFCISKEKKLRDVVHRPTGARIVVLPAPQLYVALHRRMANPYGRTMLQTFGGSWRKRLLLSPVLWGVRELSPYLATPVRPLVAELFRHNCDAVLCQDYEFPRFDVAVKVAHHLHLPVFASFQGGDYHRWALERWIRPWAMRSASGFIIGSAAEIRRVCSTYDVPANKIARIFNPLDLQDWFPIDQSEARAAIGIPMAARVAVWHGRVEIQQKGLDQLVEVWRQVCGRGNGRDLRLLLVGSGRHAGELQSKIESAKLSGVHWVNEYVHQRALLRRYLSAGDLYLFTSRHEGFPMAPVEAMACGLPVVAADASGIADIFEPGVAAGGIVVSRDGCGEPAAFVNRFATVVGELLDSPERSRVLGQAALARARQAFSLEVVGQQLASFLHYGAQTRRA
jgi:glycosyltransferase involved in cell wall biosynthesis